MSGKGAAFYVRIQHRGSEEGLEMRLGAWDRGASGSWRREVFPGGNSETDQWRLSLGQEVGEARGTSRRSGVERYGGGCLGAGKI